MMGDKFRKQLTVTVIYIGSDEWQLVALFEPQDRSRESMYRIQEPLL